MGRDTDIVLSFKGASKTTLCKRRIRRDAHGGRVFNFERRFGVAKARSLSLPQWQVAKSQRSSEWGWDNNIARSVGHTINLVALEDEFIRDGHRCSEVFLARKDINSKSDSVYNPQTAG